MEWWLWVSWWLYCLFFAKDQQGNGSLCNYQKEKQLKNDKTGTAVLSSSFSKPAVSYESYIYVCKFSYLCSTCISSNAMHINRIIETISAETPERWVSLAAARCRVNFTIDPILQFMIAKQKIGLEYISRLYMLLTNWHCSDWFNCAFYNTWLYTVRSAVYIWIKYVQLPQHQCVMNLNTFKVGSGKWFISIM